VQQVLGFSPAVFFGEIGVSAVERATLPPPTDSWARDPLAMPCLLSSGLVFPNHNDSTEVFFLPCYGQGLFSFFPPLGTGQT